MNFEGNLLFTGPGEIPHPDDRLMREIAQVTDDDDGYRSNLSGAFGQHNNYGALNRNVPRETLGTVNTDSDETPLNTISTVDSDSSRVKNGGQRNGKQYTCDVILSEEEEQESL